MIYLNLIQQEKQRRAGQRLRSILEKSIGKGLEKVGICMDNSYSELTQKEDIEQVCLEENRKKFLQTNGTSAMSGKLASELGFIGDSTVCK